MRSAGGTANISAHEAFCGGGDPACFVLRIYDQSPQHNHLGIEHGASYLRPPRNAHDRGDGRGVKLLGHGEGRTRTHERTAHRAQAVHCTAHSAAIARGTPRGRRMAGVNFSDSRSRAMLGGERVYAAFFAGAATLAPDPSNEFVGQGYSNRTATGTATGHGLGHGPAPKSRESFFFWALA